MHLCVCLYEYYSVLMQYCPSFRQVFFKAMNKHYLYILSYYTSALLKFKRATFRKYSDNNEKTDAKPKIF